MADQEEKIKEFFSHPKEKITEKIDKTPMEKFFIFFLVIITVSSLVLGYLQLKDGISRPFKDSYLSLERSRLKEQYPVVSEKTIAEKEENIRLQSLDSDLDGLDDYSEIYIYKTSAYLEDSDNDGIRDKQEVQNGTDPNCPEGEDCSVAVSDTVSTLPPQEQPVQNLINTNNLPTNLDFNGMVELQNQLLAGEITLEQLGIDNPQLEQMLKTLQSQELSPTSVLETGETNEVLESLKEMTPEDIRKELTAKGVDPAILAQVDDQTLKNLFLQTLNLYGTE